MPPADRLAPRGGPMLRWSGLHPRGDGGSATGGAPCGAPPVEAALRSRVGIGAAVDVAVAEGRRTVLLRRRWGNASAGGERLPVGVHRGTVGGVAGVDPDCGAVGACRGGVDVVAEELAGEVVLAGSARVSGHAA